MEHFAKAFRDEINGKTPDSNIIIKNGVRISVLTSRLIRTEKQPDGRFCDMPTQTVLNRSFDTPSFDVTDSPSGFTVKTDDVSFVFSPEGELLQAVMKDMYDNDFRKGNLKGTRRTLDMTKGKVKIEDGILSRDGAAIMDDSTTLVLLDDGTVRPRDEYLHRRENGTDRYVFAYGHDYKGALRDFYRLTGKTPLIPRFTLGNWWSRYKAYTQEEYLTLMKRFTDSEIPVTVATIDMDWHWVDIKKQFGKDVSEYIKQNRKIDGIKNNIMAAFQSSGWTGYSWNTELFPDYKGFLRTLQDNNYKVTVNLHPCDGVRFFEDMYDEFAQFMGIDPKSRKTIEFDVSDRKFTEGYFKFLHNRYEEEGVDFWWIDWQQGTGSAIKGLDPLWWLNHYHSIDLARDGRRPLILSRYAGPGSHRYPLGFSGDTLVLWSALDFQPYFTATASNAGYSWWSHDIGGHQMGRRDDELYIRWLQFGVFSPINRLHSTSNEFLGKEPWKFSKDTELNATKWLRFRHRLIPYIYTMNMLTHRDGRPLMEPMYYENPEDDDAYNVPNEYWFGTELIVSPITEKISRKTLTAPASTWLPEGRYTDIFTGLIYEGGRKIKMFRDISSIPVLAKEGAIIPLAVNDRTNDWKNPEDMEILIYRGKGTFTLYEDDGETMNYRNGAFAETRFDVEEDGNDMIFTINPAEGDSSVIPAERNYTLSFRDITGCEKIYATIDGKRVSVSMNISEGTISVNTVIKPGNKLKIILKNIIAKKNPPKKEMLTDLLSKVQGSNNAKMVFYTACLKDSFKDNVFMDKAVRDSIKEITYISK
ncbi:MAG: DUF5110 domain-containing protein [Clostridia bacterium]|nr:DUF5110 domain-containing protein [Clostridia bacterium]